jgi:hypothetical protein
VYAVLCEKKRVTNTSYIFNIVFSSSRVPQYKSQRQLGVLTTLSEFLFLTPTVHYISSFSDKLERMLVPHFVCRSFFPRCRSQYFSHEVVLLSCSLKSTSLLLYMLLESKVAYIQKPLLVFFATIVTTLRP